MNKKLMLLAAGALTALAFAALPTVASAEEYLAHCEVHECVGTITGGTSSLVSDNGDTITCSAVGGGTTLTTTSTTGEANLHFTGCREHVTFFTFQCNSAGAAAGTINANGLTYHLVNLEHGGTTPGIKFTNVSVTFECTGFSKKTVTGSVVGHLTEPANICNKTVTTHTVHFEQGATTGSQKYKQVTTTGTETDLIANNDAGGSYTTAAQIASGTIHWNHDVEITC